MGFNAHPRRLLLFPCLLVLYGCTTPKPAPVVKPEPTVTATPPAPPPPPPAPPPVAPAPPPPPAPLTLSNGPWTESCAQEATIAVVVSVRFAGQDRDHVGVHFLRPARTTTYRLVQLLSETPATLAQKEIPEACSSWFHLDNDETAPAGTRYSVHSTLKQFPIDPTRSITLNLRVNSQQNGSEYHIDESLLMNGVGHAVCGKSEIAASIDVVPLETALHLLAPPQAAEPTSSANATPSDWDLLHKKFQLTGHETRNDGWFQLTREASLQFPDIRFSTDQIEISEDHAMMKLRGPVRIEWDGRILTSGDAIIRVTPGTVQFEAANLQAN